MKPEQKWEIATDSEGHMTLTLEGALFKAPKRTCSHCYGRGFEKVRESKDAPIMTVPCRCLTKHIKLTGGKANEPSSNTPDSEAPSGS